MNHAFGKRSLLYLILTLASGLLACTSPTKATDMWPMLEQVSQSQCSWPARDATARVFENARQWQAVSGGQPSPLKRVPDWAQHVVLAFTTGARPTPGFTIELLGDKFEVHHDSLRIDFRERAPVAGSMQAQMLTQPCVFILVERGPWHRAAFRNADTGAEFATPRLAAGQESGR